MAIFSGPEIPNNGLVFHYDMGNTVKSWKGEPTTNVVTNANMTGGWVLSNFSGSAATITYETEDGIPHLKITNVVLGTGSPDYPRITDTTFTQTITDGFSVSFEAKGTPGEVIRLALYSTGSTKITLTATLTQSWQRYTFDNRSTGFTLNQPYIRFDTTIAGSVRYIRKIQVEQKVFATPFVVGTRSNTQAIADLTNNKVITADSLTYNSDGSFNYNGSANIASLTSSVTITTNYTAEAWIKRNVIGASHGIMSDLQYSWWLFYINNANKLSMYHARNQPTFVINSLSGTTNIGTNWTHVVSVFDSLQGLKLYVDGNLDATNSNTTIFDLGAGRGPQFIGVMRQDAAGVNSNYFNGRIDQLKIYNRALSAAEVQQNFEATRGRNGI